MRRTRTRGTRRTAGQRGRKKRGPALRGSPARTRPAQNPEGATHHFSYSCLSWPQRKGMYMLAWRHLFRGIKRPAQLSRKLMGRRAARISSCVAGAGRGGRGEWAAGVPAECERQRKEECRAAGTRGGRKWDSRRGGTERERRQHSTAAQVETLTIRGVKGRSASSAIAPHLCVPLAAGAGGAGAKAARNKKKHPRIIFPEVPCLRALEGGGKPP